MLHMLDNEPSVLNKLCNRETRWHCEYSAIASQCVVRFLLRHSLSWYRIVYCYWVGSHFGIVSLFVFAASLNCGMEA
jgi:hypothetical protein